MHSVSMQKKKEEKNSMHGDIVPLLICCHVFSPGDLTVRIRLFLGLFGIAHNSFMSCYELFFLLNTYF